MSIRRRNGRWQARFRGPDGRERSRTFDRKIDAERWITTERAALVEGRWIDPRVGDITVATFAEAWLANRPMRDQTRLGYERMLRLHILPTFGGRPLGAIRPSEVESWLSSLSTTLAASTVQVVLRVTSSLFRTAVRDRLIVRSPTDGVRAPRPPTRILEPLSLDEVAALVDAAPDRYRALIQLAAGSGLRQGELFAVTTSTLNTLRREVKVEAQLVQLDGGPPVERPPKSEASIRVVPLADVTVEAIAVHLATFGAGPGGLVFTSRSGDPLRRISFSQQWRKIVDRSTVDRERVVFHELRHFYASVLIAAGASVKVVQSRLGHSSAALTLNTYTHLWPDDSEVTRAAIQDALTGGLAVSTRSDDGLASRKAW